jgi:hypothetical protein
MAERKKQPQKVYVGVRIAPEDLAELRRLGEEAKPVPANQSEMIQVAVREYVERYGKPKGKK